MSSQNLVSIARKRRGLSIGGQVRSDWTFGCPAITLALKQDPADGGSKRSPSVSLLLVPRPCKSSRNVVPSSNLEECRYRRSDNVPGQAFAAIRTPRVNVSLPR